MDSINKGDRSTMGKWAMRALVPIVGSNEQQLEYIITHDLFGKVRKTRKSNFERRTNIFLQTKTSWWSNEGAASAHRWLLLSHIVECAPASRTMFSIVEQIVKVILRHFPNVKKKLFSLTKMRLWNRFGFQAKTIGPQIDSFDQISDEVQTRVKQNFRRISLRNLSVLIFRKGESAEIPLPIVTLHSSPKSRSIVPRRRRWTRTTFGNFNFNSQISLKINQRRFYFSWKRVRWFLNIFSSFSSTKRFSLIFLHNEIRIGRHFLQLQAAIEVLRMLQIPEIFHSFTPNDYVDLFSAATHQNSQVRHRFLQRVLNKVAQWKLSVLLLGLTVSVPNDDEDLSTGKNLKSVMERLYQFASKGSGKKVICDN